MKQKHLELRIEQCLLLAQASPCPRRKFGALLLDPARNVVLADAYNGGPRGGSALCGKDGCDRDRLGVKSGTRMEVGCHHSETNVICNAAARGVATQGSWLFVNGEPCLMCAKMLHHAGVIHVVIIGGGYAGENGVGYLEEHGVAVTSVTGPQDTRSAALLASGGVS